MKISKIDLSDDVRNRRSFCFGTAVYGIQVKLYLHLLGWHGHCILNPCGDYELNSITEIKVAGSAPN